MLFEKVFIGDGAFKYDGKPLEVIELVGVFFGKKNGG